MLRIDPWLRNRYSSGDRRCAALLGLLALSACSDSNEGTGTTEATAGSLSVGAPAAEVGAVVPQGPDASPLPQPRPATPQAPTAATPLEPMAAAPAEPTAAPPQEPSAMGPQVPDETAMDEPDVPEDDGSTLGSETPAGSMGCGKAPPASDTSISVGGSTGSYILDLPSDYDNTKPYPLVFSWHGFGVNNSSFHNYLNLSEVIGNDAILVTPECLDGGSMWPSDMAYPDALLEHFSSNYCIDTGRVFTTGHSMGGMYTGRIGCERGDKFRGNAVLAAPHPSGNCVESNMGVMMSVGDSDFVANGDSEFSWWANFNGCDPSMTTPVDPMQCVEYGGCEPDRPVRTCSFNGGHEIPNWVAGAVWGFFKTL